MIETVISSIVPSLLVGMVLFYWEQRTKKQDRQKSTLEDLAVESDMLRLDLEVATAELSYATAMAVKRGTPNGEMEPAIEHYEHAIEKFRKFERKHLAITDHK